MDLKPLTFSIAVVEKKFWATQFERFYAMCSVKARLHHASVSMLQQLCSDATDTVLIENNGVTQKRVANLIWNGSIVFNENSIISFITDLLQH